MTTDQPPPTLAELSEWHRSRAEYHKLGLGIARSQGEPARVDMERRCRDWHEAAARQIEAMAGQVDRLLEACRVIATAELYDPTTGIIDANVLEICQDVARAALAVPPAAEEGRWT